MKMVMKDPELSDADLQQMRQLDITEAQVRQQIELFSKPPNFIRLNRPCTLGDGIVPGLWNGSMADWITVFVEVPGVTFDPVKTVADLLRLEHQAKP